MKKYFSIVGVDGSGKTTVAKAVSERLGMRYTREPGGSPLAEAVRGVLLGGKMKVDSKTEFLLFWASRFAHIGEVVVPELQSHDVVSDRGDACTWAYQIVGRNIGIDHPALERVFWELRSELPKTPDLYIHLVVSTEEAKKRLLSSGRANEKNHFDLMGDDFFKKVAVGYEDFFAFDPSIKVRTINADKPIEEVVEEVVEAIVCARQM